LKFCVRKRFGLNVLRAIRFVLLFLVASGCFDRYQFVYSHARRTAEARLTACTDRTLQNEVLRRSETLHSGAKAGRTGRLNTDPCQTKPESEHLLQTVADDHDFETQILKTIGVA